MQAVENPRAPISIVVAVRVRLYREGLTSVLQAQAHLRVKGAVGTALEAQAAVRDLQPNVLIVDVSLPDVGDAIRAIHQQSPHSRILAFGVAEDIATILDYAEAGADGFVTASGSGSELVEAIERIAAGELLCSPRIAAQLLRRAAQQITSAIDQGRGAMLTIREQHVYSLLKQGLANKEIASSLGIAEATVKNHVHHVLEKLQVTSRGQAAASTRSQSQATLSPYPPARQAS
jgi:two-component system nitrate/nitrite response regulator NarL